MNDFWLFAGVLLAMAQLSTLILFVGAGLKGFSRSSWVLAGIHYSVIFGFVTFICIKKASGDGDLALFAMAYGAGLTALIAVGTVVHLLRMRARAGI